jgi:hypothetical protein
VSPITGQEFVQRYMEALGIKGASELARSIDLPGYWSPQRVKRWIDGTSSPDFESTMLMLERAGWLAITENPNVAIERAAAAQARRGEGAVEDRLRDVQDELGRLTSEVSRLARAVEESSPR